jgi:predicted nucleotide-binding protein
MGNRTDRRKQVLLGIQALLARLTAIWDTFENDKDINIAYERLSRWKQRTIKFLDENISQTESRQFVEIFVPGIYKPELNFEHAVEIYKKALTVLTEELEDDPYFLPPIAAPKDPMTSNESSSDTRFAETSQDTRNVFVVHGRNLEARNSLFRFLRSIGLKPLEWSQAIKSTGKASPFIGEILDVAFTQAQAVVVLMTPDDVAQLRDPFRSSSDHPYESQLTGQARPNVLFEAGMAMGRNPNRTIIIELGTLRPFSDIAGRHTIRLSNDSAARQELAQRLETAGCPVDLTGRDWHAEGDFTSEILTRASSEPSQDSPNQPDEHDKQLFSKFQGGLPSKSRSIRFLRDDDSGVSFPSEWLDDLYDFIHQWNNAEHEFNSPELEKKRLEFWQSLNTFLRELGKYTSSTVRDGWLSIGLKDMEDRPEMLEAHERLNNLGTAAYEAHQNLVREGRRLGFCINESEMPSPDEYRGIMEGLG